MDLTNYLMVPPTPIYTLVDYNRDMKYIFVGKYEATDGLITKIITKTKLEPSQNALLKQYYGDISLTDTNVTLIKCFINVDDTITTIKQKIATYVKPGVVPEKQHLWVIKNKLSGDDVDSVLIRLESNSNNITVVNGKLKEYEIFLGLEYRNAHGIKLIRGDINTITEKQYPEFDDNLYNVHSRLLETYGNIKNNTIYITTLDSVVNITDDSRKLFFPLANEDNLGVDTFKAMINKANAPTANPAAATVANANATADDAAAVVESAIIKANLNSDYFKKIDLNFVFINYELSPEVPYIKFANELYRLYTKINQDRTITRGFKLPSKYIIDYERGYYEPIVSMKQMLGWVKNPLTHREKQYIKEQKYYNEYSNTTDLNFKIAHKGEYIDLIINIDGLCNVRNMHGEIDDSIIKKCNAVIKTINKMTKYTLLPLTKSNMSVMTFDFRYNVDADKFPMAKLKSYIETLRGVYLLPQALPDKLHLKYAKVNLYNTIVNYKKLFLKLKQTTTNLTVSQFSQLWMRESTRIFAISEAESVTVLNKILEQYSSEDLKKSNIDYEIDIIISKNFTDKKKQQDNYTIEIANCYNMAQASRIRKFIVTILTQAKNKRITAAAAATAASAAIMKTIDTPVPATKFAADDDELDLDDDFLDLDEDEDEAEDDIDLEVETVAEVESEVEDEASADIQLGKNSLRNYMADMRKLDSKLFKYKTGEGHQAYSIKCGAVDMRQPIILTRAELRNFEQKNPEGFGTLAKLEWGSSDKTKNFYICPRIWCIRDKIALSDKQFVENKGQCPFCNGEVIDSQTKEMSGNQTVIIRRAGSNKYWSNPEIFAKKTKAWQKLLYDTEKDAYPGFLDPKLHPDGFCMPCCNTNKHWNYSKCLTIPIDAVVETKKHLADVETDVESVLVLDAGAIYNVNKMTSTKEFTKIKLPLQEGMVFKVSDELHMYEVIVDKNGGFKFKKTTGKMKKPDERYLLGVDKFPLPADKIGALPKSIDDIFDNDTLKKTIKSKLHDNITIFTRRGVPQIPFNSFLCCMAYLKEMSLTELLGRIVANLMPEEYIGLNNGDVFLGFAIAAVEEDTALFEKWLLTYSEFAEKYKTRRKFMNKVFLSMENFKKYCGDMNVQKEPIFFQDLLSKRNPWFFKKGLNIVILERQVVGGSDKIYIHMPQVDDLQTLYDDYDSTCILYKYRGLYEPITITKTVKTKTYFINYYTKHEINLDASILPRINNMVNIVVSNGDYVENTHIYTAKLEHVSELMQRQQRDSIPASFRPKYFVHDEYNKGIGICLENNVILYSSPFAINRYSKLEKRLASSIKKMKSNVLKNNLDILEIQYGAEILDDGKITGIMMDSGYIHPVKNAEYETQSLSDYETVISENSIAKQNYDNFKRELANVFQSKNKSIADLKQSMQIIISNDVMPIRIRRIKIWEIMVILVKNITNPKEAGTSRTKKTCGELSGKRCLRSKKCSRGPGNGGVPIVIGDKTIMLSFTRCRLNIPQGMTLEFTKNIANELLLSHQVRLEIFENRFKLERSIVVLNRETIVSEIKKYYKGNNFYLTNNVKSIRPMFYIPDPLVKVIRDSNLIIAKAPATIMASTITDTGIDMAIIKDVKAGKCIFPYKKESRGEIETYNQCIVDKNYRHGYVCATEVDADGHQLKYGYCNSKIKLKIKRKKKKVLEPPADTIPGYNGPHINKYLSGYASKEKFDNLKSAAEHADLLGNKCGGITLELNGKYSVRKGTELKSVNKLEYSWVRL
jgi:hypothetical protein